MGAAGGHGVLDPLLHGRDELPRYCAPDALVDELKADGIRLQTVEARSSVRDRLRGEGLEEQLGGINRFTSVADAVDNFSKA